MLASAAALQLLAAALQLALAWAAAPLLALALAAAAPPLLAQLAPAAKRAAAAPRDTPWVGTPVCGQAEKAACIRCCP